MAWDGFGKLCIVPTQPGRETFRKNDQRSPLRTGIANEFRTNGEVCRNVTDDTFRLRYCDFGYQRYSPVQAIGRQVFVSGFGRLKKKTGRLKIERFRKAGG